MRKMIFLSLFFVSWVQAAPVNDGGSVGNGGDPLGLEFMQDANKVIEDVLGGSESLHYPELRSVDLRGTLAITKVTVTDDTLWVTIDGRPQISTAINFPATKSIVLNRKLWQQISNRQQKLSLAFHEMLGLVGLEKSGDYSISKRYILKEFDSSELLISTQPFYLIPAKAVSCYSHKTTPPNENPVLDVADNYIRIPTLGFFKSDGSKDLVISMLRITYALPAEKGGLTIGQCMVGGDQLLALSSQWWDKGEAVIPANASSHTVFQTDCALYCGGIQSRSAQGGFAISADVDVFGVERDPKTGDEVPVKMNRTIKIQSF